MPPTLSVARRPLYRSRPKANVAKPAYQVSQLTAARRRQNRSREARLPHVPGGHVPFALWNRTGNQLIRMVLLSPVHRVLSRKLALITVTGRRTGRQHTFPVGYKRDGERVTILVGLPERKVWWRNLRDSAPVRLRLAGQEHTGNAQVHGDERSGVSVEVLLDPRA
jgi:hypothetical protein